MSSVQLVNLASTVNDYVVVSDQKENSPFADLDCTNVKLDNANTVYTYTNGFNYIGETQQGIPHGKGSLFCDCRLTTYEGGFMNGRMHGKGKLVINHETFIGDFVNGKPHGQITYLDREMNRKFIGTYLNGDFVGNCSVVLPISTYYGTVKNGKLHGRGKITFNVGDTCEGELVDDYFCGEVTYTYAKSHNVYQGKFALDEANGFGRYTYYEGPIKYSEGEWRGDKLTGQGKIVYVNGDVYEGQLEDGQEEGFGTMTYATGDVYTGNFEDGNRNGEGTDVCVDGTVYHGQYKDNSVHGECVVKYSDGEKFIGTFKNGLKHGVGRLFTKNKVYLQTWKNDICLNMTLLEDQELEDQDSENN